MITFGDYLIEGDGLWANIHKKRKSGKKMRKPGSKGAPTKQDFKNASEGAGKYKGETWEDGYKWRIKGKEKDNISLKLYKTKPDFTEYKKQMKRVAGHEFGG